MSVVETTVTTSDVLHRAADLLSEWDWCQGAARSGDAICGEGAIYFALTGRLPDGEFVEPEDEALPDGYREACCAVLRHGGIDTCNEQGMRGLYVWNDEAGRTKAEVVALFRKTATSLAAKHDGEDKSTTIGKVS